MCVGLGATAWSSETLAGRAGRQAGRQNEAYMDKGHDVVAATFLFLPGDVERGIADVKVGPHLVEGLVGDLVDAQFLLGLGQP